MPKHYRADHVGSFLRPAELLAARNNTQTTPEELQALENLLIERVIARQRELGFEFVTDGELRRRNFMSDFTDAVDGFDLGDAVARSWSGARNGPVSGRSPGMNCLFSGVPAACP